MCGLFLRPTHIPTLHSVPNKEKARTVEEIKVHQSSEEAKKQGHTSARQWRLLSNVIWASEIERRVEGDEAGIGRKGVVSFISMWQ